jgi:3,4-dihydroxy-2-butanone 4-phosphate synthase
MVTCSTLFNDSRSAQHSVIMAPVAVLTQTTLPLSTSYDSFSHPLSEPDILDLSSPPKRAPKERTPPRRTTFAFDTVESAVAAIARGEFVVVMDDEARENEGDLIIPAAGCSTEQMAWMIKHTR